MQDSLSDKRQLGVSHEILGRFVNGSGLPGYLDADASR